MKFLRLMTMAMIVLAASAAPSFAQKQPPPVCPLKQAPEFNGFRLGMSIFEVRDTLADPSMFDSKLTVVSKLGSQTISVLGSELKDDHTENVETMNLTFVDKRLAIIKATYPGGDWMGAKDYFKQLSEKMSLPEPSAAEAGSGARGGEKYRVECKQFNVTLSYSFGVSPGVLIADAAAQKLVDERLEKNPDGETKEIRITPGRPRNPNPPR